MRKIGTTLAVALMATVAWANGTAGGLDTSFDGDGVVRTAGLAGGQGMVADAAVTDGNGDTYVVGYTPDSTGAARVAVRRYGPTGLADLTYGDNSGVALPLPASVTQRPTGAALDAQGRLLVAGLDLWDEVVAGKGKKTSTRRVQAGFVARLETTGELDTNFGDGGVVRLELDEALQTSASNVTVLPGGEVLVTGWALVETTTSGGGGKGKKNSGTTVVSHALMLVQLEGTNGAYDLSFGDAGVVLDDRSSDDDSISAGGVARQSDGSIVVGGIAAATGDGFVRRYDALGDLDDTFANSGEALLKMGFTWGGVSVAVDGLDRVLAAFSVAGGSAGSVEGAVVRLDADGDVDRSFGSDGEFRTTTSGNDDLSKIAVVSDGSVYAAGTVFPGSGEEVQLLRLTAKGALDATFGTNGYADSLPMPSGYNQVRSLVVDANGDAILAGEYFPLMSTGSLEPGFLARYCGD